MVVADIAVGIWYIACVGRLRQFVATSRVGLLLSCQEAIDESDVESPAGASYCCIYRAETHGHFCHLVVFFPTIYECFGLSASV